MVLFVWYFVSWFIVLFFNVAVIECASIRLRGGDPTVADGFRAVVSAALSGIFRTALYLYATEGRTPEGFTPDYVQNAFAVNKRAATNFSLASR